MKKNVHLIIVSGMALLAFNSAVASNCLPGRLTLRIAKHSNFVGNQIDQSLKDQIDEMKQSTVSQLANDNTPITAAMQNLTLESSFHRMMSGGDETMPEFKTRAAALAFCHEFRKNVDFDSLQINHYLSLAADRYLIGQYRPVSCQASCVAKWNEQQCIPQITYTKVKETFLNREQQQIPSAGITNSIRKGPLGEAYADCVERETQKHYDMDEAYLTCNGKFHHRMNEEN